MKKNVFDGGSLDEAIQRLPGGKSRMDAYLEAIPAGGRRPGQLLADDVPVQLLL